MALAVQCQHLIMIKQIPFDHHFASQNRNTKLKIGKSILNINVGPVTYRTDTNILKNYKYRPISMLMIYRASLVFLFPLCVLASVLPPDPMYTCSSCFLSRCFTHLHGQSLVFISHLVVLRVFVWFWIPSESVFVAPSLHLFN